MYYKACVLFNLWYNTIMSEINKQKLNTEIDTDEQKDIDELRDIVLGSIEREVEMAKKNGVEYTKQDAVQHWKDMIALAEKS